LGGERAVVTVVTDRGDYCHRPVLLRPGILGASTFRAIPEPVIRGFRVHHAVDLRAETEVE
jgi:hypothetical protein